jgi:hypothetical protein
VPRTSSINRRSHGNDSGWLQLISLNRRCVGLRSTLYSTGMMTDGTSVASSFPLFIQSCPACRVKPWLCSAPQGRGLPVGEGPTQVDVGET